jgi:hypothetical protein
VRQSLHAYGYHPYIGENLHKMLRLGASDSFHNKLDLI